MAEKALQKVEEDLNCLVCLDTYTDPKLLQCHHVFCRGCLEGLVKQDQRRQLILTCPECRQVTPVPAGGVAGLQAAFHINHLLDILKEHKKATGETRYCPKHPTRELESFCETCDKLICLECVLDQHQGHKCDLVRKLIENYTKEIKSSLDPVKDCFQVAHKALDELNTRDKEILDQQSSIEEKICEHTRKIQEAAEVRKVELINKLQKITDDKRQDLASQRIDIETTLAQLSSYLDTVHKSLETSSQEELVKMKTSVKQQAKELTECFQPDTLKLEVEADMKAFEVPDSINMVQSSMDVFAAGSPDPAQCQATGKSLEVATVGEKSTVLLQAIDYEGKPCKKIQSLECELVSELTGKKVSGNVQRSGQSQYKISYQPIIKGRHQLHIKISDQHIRGSPFSVAVKLPVEKLGAPIQTLKANAIVIAIHPKGELGFTEEDNIVSIMSPNGDRYKSFGTVGSEHGQFDCPGGVTVDGVGNIIVADTYNHRIQQFTAEGQFLRAVGTKGNKPLQFHEPTDVAFNTNNGKFYVLDQNCVQILNSDLTFYNTFGKHGNNKGQFNYPSGIACGSTGKVYVADTDNNRIQVFTAEGKFLRMYNTQIQVPFGIAVDASDMVYVTQPYAHSVSVFTCEGEFVTSFSTRLKDEEETDVGPIGIAVDNDGLVYLCDAEAQKIKIF